MALDNYKELTQTIPAKTEDEMILSNNDVTGPNILRKLNYAVEAINMGDANRVRYIAVRYKDYLDLKRTKEDSGGQLLFHDSDIEKIRAILILKDRQNKSDAEIVEILRAPGKRIIEISNEPEKESDQVMNSLVKKVTELMHAMMDENMKNNALLLEQKNKDETKLREEIASLRKELEERDKKIIGLIENNLKKKKFHWFKKD